MRTFYHIWCHLTRSVTVTFNVKPSGFSAATFSSVQHHPEEDPVDSWWVWAVYGAEQRPPRHPPLDVHHISGSTPGILLTQTARVQRVSGFKDETPSWHHASCSWITASLSLRVRTSGSYIHVCLYMCVCVKPDSVWTALLLERPALFSTLSTFSTSRVCQSAAWCYATECC